LSARGLRFECTGCGACCTARGEYAYVYLNDDEVGALADELRVSVREFRRKYTFVDELGWTQLRFEGETCVFLEPGTRRCTVYGARPTQCRTPAARALCEGIGRGPLHRIEDVEARMLEMELADET
jgi:Fe-S-cluster containining protein